MAGLVGAAVIVAFLLIAVFPTRTWLDQREQTAERSEELSRIRAEQAELEADVEELKSPEAVESAARRDHGMVLPGETPFRMAPQAVPPVELPDTWPFTGAADWLNR